MQKQPLSSDWSLTPPAKLDHCSSVDNIQLCKPECEFITFPIKLVLQCFWNKPSCCLLSKVFKLKEEREGKFNLKSSDPRSAPKRSCHCSQKPPYLLLWFHCSWELTRMADTMRTVNPFFTLSWCWDLCKITFKCISQEKSTGDTTQLPYLDGSSKPFPIPIPNLIWI